MFDLCASSGSSMAGDCEVDSSTSFNCNNLCSVRFVMAEKLGAGSFGSVKLAHDVATRKLVAMKSLSRRNVNKYVEAEIINHSQLRHPHVVQFKEVFLTPDYVNIVMEYANGGSLFELVRTQGRLKETQARWFFQQLILAIDYCHRRGVANRDIKLENCLLQNEEGMPFPLLKLCDFGYSKADFSSAAKSQVGTLSYMAPEVLESMGLYDAKTADIWSCGVVLYIMIYGKYPFDAMEHDQDPHGTAPSEAGGAAAMLRRMHQEEYPLRPGMPVSPECLDLLRRMLRPNPSHRITLDAILHHPWFNKYLPPHALDMNAYYLALPVPSTHQQLHQIRHLLQAARKEAQAHMAPTCSNVQAESATDDSESVQQAC